MFRRRPRNGSYCSIRSLQRVQILSELLQKKNKRFANVIPPHCELSSASQTLRQQYASSSLHWTFKTFVETAYCNSGKAIILLKPLKILFRDGTSRYRQWNSAICLADWWKRYKAGDTPNIFLSDQEAEALGLATYKRRLRKRLYLTI